MPGRARATPPEGAIRSVRRDLVYVDLGRAQGIEAGDVLAVDGSTVRLRVVHLGEKQLAAARVGTGELRLGAVVRAPREAGGPGVRRPVVVLPAPGVPPDRLPWGGDPLRRAALVPSPRLGPAPRPRVSGDVRIGYGAMIGRDLDLHQAELRTRLRADLGGGFTYRHDLAVRAELGPGLDERAGAGARPWHRLRELAVSWRSPGFATGFEDSEPGALELQLGRLRPGQGTAGFIDGARADVALGGGFGVGMHGGLAPGLRDLAPSTRRPLAGGHATWIHSAEEWRAFASLTELTSFWRGALDRMDLGLSGALAKARDFDLYGSLVATLVDGPPDSGTPSGLSLTRAFFGARVRPFDALTVDLHYAHDRWVADRESLELLGADRIVADARESTWLQVRFEPTPALALALSGTFGFGSSAAEQAGGAARLTLRDVGPLRFDLAYALAQSAATVTHHPSIDVALPLGDSAELALGYGYTRFGARVLEEVEDEHRVDLGFDLFAAGPWRLHLRGSYAFGTAPGQLSLSSVVVWRFP